MPVTVRNTLNNERHELPTDTNQTVKEAIENSGFVLGDFSARDKNGNVVDSQPISQFEGQIVNVGLPGSTIEGG